MKNEMFTVALRIEKDKNILFKTNYIIIKFLQ